MMISSAPVPSILPGTPAADSSAETADTTEVGLFDLLLPAAVVVDAKVSADGGASALVLIGLPQAEVMEGPMADFDETEGEMVDGEGDDLGAPTLAEQTNLAALLYTLSAPVPVPVPKSLVAGEPTVAIEETWEAESPALSSSLSENTEPKTTALRSDGAVPKPGPKEVLPATQITPALPAITETTAPTKSFESEGAIPPVTTRPTQPNAPVQPAPKVDGEIGLREPAAAVPVAPVDFSAGVPGETKPLLPETANFAAAPKTGLMTPEIFPAKSSPAPAAELVFRNTLPISESTAKADKSLIPEPKAMAKKSRGTAVAKSDSAMIEASAMNQNSISSVPVARPSGSGSSMPVTTLGDQLSGQTGQMPGEAQEAIAASSREVNRGSAEPFSLPTPTISSSVARPLDASGPVLTMTPPKPMAPAAVLEEVGLNLERIQQHGSNRLDLHLSLEGGGQVSIQLQMRDGAVQASITTGSPELREALQQGWAQLASRSESLGMPLADPIFKASAPVSANAGQQDFRERRQDPPPEQHPSFLSYAASHSGKRPNQPKIPQRTTSGLNTWA